MLRRLTLLLMLLSIFWILPAHAQVGSQGSPAWVLSAQGDQLTANITRIPLRLVLEALAKQVPLRLSVSEGWRDYPVTANFRALPLEEALARLLAGLPYAIIYAPAHPGAGPAAKRQIVELMVLAKAPAAPNPDGVRHPSASVSNPLGDLTSNTESGSSQRQETTLERTPEWAAALEHPDKDVRLEALQRWAEQGAATPLDPLTQALVDPDESVRARAQELVERVWAAKAEAR